MRSRFGLVAALMICAGARVALSQTIITQWDFDAVGPVGPIDPGTGLPSDAPLFSSGTIYNSPTPTRGSGVATPLGMDNNYTFDTNPPTLGSVAACDVTSTSGVNAQAAFNAKCWRVRGPSNAASSPGNGNGWNRSAPERTQGAQFSASTAGFSNIKFSCQFYCTTQGVSTARAQYTLNGTTWTDFGPIINLNSNDFLTPLNDALSVANPGVQLDFSSVPGASNNPNFGVRLVSVYDPRFLGGSYQVGTSTITVNPPNYAAASSPSNTPYNNSSGNWRFAQVSFTGTATGPTNPVATSTNNGSVVCSSSDNDITFNVQVQPGQNPASTGTTVIADLSQFGLSNQQMMTGNPAGTFFSYTAHVPANTIVVSGSPVNKAATFSIADGQGRVASATSTIKFVNCAAGTSNSTVVISQIYGGGGKTDALNAANQGIYDTDYIELYNRSASPVNLNGWSVQYSSATNAAGFNNPTNQVNLSGTIQPQQYMLVRFSDPARGFLPTPTPDFSTVYGYGGLGNTGGRVVLSGTTAAIGTSYTSTNIKDFVGYGSTAITFEGAGPAPTPDNAHAVIRKSTGTDSHAGAQDTNQNFFDFTLGTPVPHNRANNGTSAFLTAYAAIPNLVPDSVQNALGVCAGSTVKFTVAVSPASNSTNIQVVADTSGFTGSVGSTALFDDGSHGDVTANDNIFTLDYAVPANSLLGARSVVFTATDAQSGSASSTLSVNVGTCTDSGSPVVLTKIFGGGAHFDFTPNMDFAEIYNRSSSPVDLTGWNMQYADANGSFSATKVINLSGMIGPGERRLINPQPSPGIGIQIPAGDFQASLPGFGFDNHFGRVAIVKPIPPATTAALLTTTGTTVTDARGLVDLVGYGSVTPTFESVAPAGTLENGTWIVRKNNGNQDFNQNLIDFDVLYILDVPHTTRTLTVQRTGSGTGTVTSDIGGINCGSTCSAILDRDSMVTLTATPASNSTFAGWTGACTGTGPCVVTLTDAVSVTARFNSNCRADFNGQGGVTVQDIFDFLQAWFAGSPSADFNGQGGVTVQDIFDFLQAWFAGC